MQRERHHPPHHQVGSLRSTLGVTTALRSAKGSFSSSSSSGSDSSSSAATLDLPGTMSGDWGLDIAEGRGGATGRAGWGGGGGEDGVMLRPAISLVGLRGELGDLVRSVITWNTSVWG